MFLVTHLGNGFSGLIFSGPPLLTFTSGKKVVVARVFSHAEILLQRLLYIFKELK